MIIKRDFTAEAALERIREANGRFNAVSQIIDDKGSAACGPLRGMPVTVKDNINVAGFATTGGSMSLSDHAQSEDAEVVKRLRAAGAVIVGKSTLSEMAGFVSTTMPSGYSERFGQTINARHPGANPGGSSSGAAACVAAGFVPAAIGTETNGSVLMPALRQEVVGFKPAHGWMPLDGILPISHRFDTVGIIADSAATAQSVWLALSPQAAAPAEGGLLRIGVCDGMPENITNALSNLLGPAVCRSIPEGEGGYRVLTSYDIRRDLSQWLQRYGGPGPKDFDDFFHRVRLRGHPYGFDRLEGAARLDAVSEEDPRVRTGLDAKDAVTSALAAALEDVDLLASCCFSSAWALSGYPAVAVNGFVLGAKPGDEARLLSAAQLLEKAGIRIQPQLA